MRRELPSLLVRAGRCGQHPDGAASFLFVLFRFVLFRFVSLSIVFVLFSSVFVAFRFDLLRYLFIFLQVQQWNKKPAAVSLLKLSVAHRH